MHASSDNHGQTPADGTVGAMAHAIIAAIHTTGDSLRARKRISLIQTHILGPYGHLPLVGLRRADLLRLKFRLSARSRHVAANVITEFKVIYKLARANLLIRDEDIPDLDLPRRPDDRPTSRLRDEKTALTGLSEEDFVAIWGVAEGDDRMLLLLAFGFALRQQEIRAALNGCVVLDHVTRTGYFSVAAAISSEGAWTSVTKTGKAPRTVEFGETIYGVMQPVVAAQSDGKRFFLGNRAEFYGPEYLNDRFQALCLKAGVTRTEPDPKRPGAVRTVARSPLAMARRMGASLWINDGVPEDKVRRWMGHARVEMSHKHYYYDTRKIGKERPAPSMRPRSDVSFFCVAKSRPAAAEGLTLPRPGPRPSMRGLLPVGRRPVGGVSDDR